MATSRNALTRVRTDFVTDGQVKELERMGFCVGYNCAYLTGEDGAPRYYVWFPGVIYSTPEMTGDKFWADPNPRPSASGKVAFDDPITAARYLLVEVSNG